MTTLIIGLISIGAIIGIRRSINKAFDKPTLMKAYYDGDQAGIALDLKKDGSFIFDSFCLGSKYQHGTYQIHGDTIELEEKFSSALKANKFIITSKPMKLGNSDTDENYLVQLDSLGIQIDHSFLFRITQDNR